MDEILEGGIADSGLDSGDVYFASQTPERFDVDEAVANFDFDIDLD